MKKLILINPTIEGAAITFNEPLGLGIVAALTPDSYDVELIDEHFEDFSFIECDLVGITATTASITRAYNIASLYLEKGIPVIIGGFHATLTPDEAINYCTSIVVGQAELSWPQVIIDFENNNLKKIYGKTINKCSSTKIIKANREIFQKYRYPSASIETSRGCPRNCEFCSVASFYNSNYFVRPINDIIEEIKTINNKLVFFTDDNFIGDLSDKERIIKLLTSLIPLKKKWYAYATINIIEHKDILRLLKKSGCVMLFIGFETLDVSELDNSQKTINHQILNKYDLQKCVKILHKYRISVMGGFIYGLDTDSVSTMSIRQKIIIES
ncbi:MAG: radical SAM protein, partial [Bacteroidales bacterium]|nr:radical SAM protein [Bacteroidales bacterium]